MERRRVLSLLAGGLVPWSLSAWSLSVGAQQTERVRVIGVLIGLAENDPDVPSRIAVFEQGLRELGWIKGRNVEIHYRVTNERDRLQTLAKELIALQPELIVASSSFVVFALLRETSTVPIVFVTAADPVGDRFVAGLGQPGGNVTGFTNSLSSMSGKWVELLKEIAPGIKRVAIMFNPETAASRGSYFLPPFKAAAALNAVQPVLMPVHNSAEINSALAEFGDGLAHGLVVIPDTFTTVHRGLIIEQAARFRVPAIYPFRYFATDGGLMSYGADLLDLYRRTPWYVDRIFRGSRPAHLPVQSPDKLDLVINLKVANALRLSVPRIMIARASEVIE
jgi:putative ABC transport system substrate-binding protein